MQGETATPIGTLGLYFGVLSRGPTRSENAPLGIAGGPGTFGAGLGSVSVRDKS